QRVRQGVRADAVGAVWESDSEVVVSRWLNYRAVRLQAAGRAFIMADGFFEKWGKYLFNWYGFVFTVLGAVVGLLLAREYWWVSVLIVVATFLASGFFAYHHHRTLVQAQEQH